MASGRKCFAGGGRKGTTPPPNSIGAAEIYKRLKAEGILVRYFDHPRLHDKLRISIGTKEQNQVLLENLRHLCR